MNKLETLINTVGNDLMGLAKAAIKEYGFNEKWDSLPIEVHSYGFNEFLDMALDDADGNYEIAFKRLHLDSEKIFQSGTYFDSNTNKICKVEFLINMYMITCLLANYGTMRLEEYLYEACKHEVGHMVDALIELDGKGIAVRSDYYGKMADEYKRFDEWYDAQTPETMTTAQGRMEYFKIPYEQRANKYGHVDTDLVFEILKEFDKFNEAYNENERE